MSNEFEPIPIIPDDGWEDYFGHGLDGSLNQFCICSIGFYNDENLIKHVAGLGFYGDSNVVRGDLPAEHFQNLPSNLTNLVLICQGAGDTGAQTIAEHLGSLKTLEISYDSIGETGALAIAEHLGSLSTLNIRCNEIGATGAQAIAEHLCGLKSLAVDSNEIGKTGARAIAEHLGSLCCLDISDNRIGEYGTRAITEHLSSLRKLNIGNNRIGEAGAMSIAAHLSSLSSLFIRSNRIGENGVQSIANRLSSLTSLDIAANAIGDSGAQSIAQHLRSLSSLDIGFNRIGEKGAWAIAEHLTILNSLDISNNRIGETGAQAILSSLVANNSQIQTLNLNSNGDLSSVLPTEVLRRSQNAQSILATYRTFQQASAENRLGNLNEAKLLVVGEEAVGKTSLIKFLTKDEPRDKDEKKTSGVEQQKIETQQWQASEGSIRLNIWDFGGQEIMHNTHRFFLTNRSLYLLVLTARREDDQKYFNWLKVIRNCGGDSPIIIVINGCDDGEHNLDIAIETLKEDYPNIVEVVITSCNDDDPSRERIKQLRELIVATLENDSRLKHIRDPFPDHWAEVKNQIEGMAKEESVLELDDFEKTCQQCCSPIKDKHEQGALLGLLNDIGTVVAHGLVRGTSASQQKITLLDPNWLTGAIYKLLNSPVVKDAGGEFTRSQLGDLLDADLYPANLHQFILDMMKHADIGLCFPIHGGDDNSFLIPEALPSSRPKFTFEPKLRFRFKYDFLPKGFLPRFIVQAHQKLTNPPLRWKTGVILQFDNCRMKLEANADKKQLDIEVEGPDGMLRSALNVALSDLNIVHKMNPEMRPVALVPFPDNHDEDVKYKHLLALEEMDGPDHKFLPERGERVYSVGELLNSVRWEVSRIPDDEGSSSRGTPLPSSEPTMAISVRDKERAGEIANWLDDKYAMNTNAADHNLFEILLQETAEFGGKQKLYFRIGYVYKKFMEPGLTQVKDSPGLPTWKKLFKELTNVRNGKPLLEMFDDVSVGPESESFRKGADNALKKDTNQALVAKLDNLNRFDEAASPKSIEEVRKSHIDFSEQRASQRKLD